MSWTKLSYERPLPAVALLVVALGGFASLLVSINWAGTNNMSSADDVVINGYRALWASPVDMASSLSAFEAALRGDPASPLRWQDLGGAFLKAGRLKQADYCFQQAIHLAPHVPAVQMRLANFEMQTGQTLKALAVMREILAETAAYDEIIFSYYQRLALATGDILDNGIPETPRAATAFFLNSLPEHDSAKTHAIQKWAAAHGLMQMDKHR
jgi:tetratricopeptide (TPR) repeat protein